MNIKKLIFTLLSFICLLPSVAKADAPAINGIFAQTVLTANVTGNSSAQTVTVGNATACGTGGLIYIGGINREFAVVTGVPSATQVTAIIQNSHSSGDLVECQIVGTVTTASSGTVTIGPGTNTIGAVTLQANSSTTNMVVTQLDFSTNAGAASCQPATVYDGSTAPAQTSSIFCYIIKNGPGTLYSVEWNSSQNMSTLTPNVLVTCFDKGTTGQGTGNNVVWQGMMGAGQVPPLFLYGRPFKIGLECQSSSAITSTTNNFFETETK